MNKKLLYGMIVPLMVAVVLVSAFILVTYGSVEQEIEVKTPILVTSSTETITAWLGQETVPIEGALITIENVAPFDVDVEISNDATDGIEVVYNGELTLSKKDVDFTKDKWDLISGDEVTIKYTIVGNEFSVEVIDNVKGGYELIYYKDNSDRFNSPAQAISTEEVIGNLPYEDDKNNDEYDYCSTGEYLTCHGAKIWYVPSDVIDVEHNLDWSRADEFYYETRLIQFNSDGKITIYKDTTLNLIPVYTIVASSVGTNTVTTNVNNIE